MGIELVAALASGLAILLFVLYFSAQARNRPADVRVRRLAERPAATRAGLSWDEIRRRGPSSLPLLRNVLVESAWSQRTALEIEQTGLKMRVGEYLIIRLVFGLGGFFLIWMVGRSFIAFVLAVVGGFFISVLPSIWIAVLRRRRLDRISKQMPEAVSMMANALRAGFAFQHGVDMVATQLDAPASEEFARIIVDMNLGSTVEEALGGFLKRCDSEDVNLVVTAVLIQRTSGGNLAEILETVGETMREKERLTGEVKTMTSQQRFSGSVLAIWPLIVFGIFAAASWQQTSLLFTTNAGLLLVAIGATLEVIGFYAIRRILDIDI